MNYKQSDCPSLGLRLIKMDYFKVGQGLGLERVIVGAKMELHEEWIEKEQPNFNQIAWLPMLILELWKHVNQT